MTSAHTEAPVSDIDPFSDAFLTDPYSHHETLRALGPVVRLERYGVWALTNDREVRAVLGDWAAFCSSAGVGLTDFRKEKPWRQPSLLLETDPPEHTRNRTIITRIMAPAAIRDLRATFQAEADALVDRLVAKGEFDALTDLAEAYPLKVFPDAVGLPAEGRENLLPYGTMAFNAFGPPNNARFLESAKLAETVIPWIMSKCRREALAPDGFGMQIFAAADSGEITEDEAGLLVRSFLTAGVDTTVNGLGNLLYCLVNHPDQWDRLRAEPGLAKQAFDEMLRFEGPVQTFFRTTTRPVEMGGVQMGEGEKVLCFLAAANRDPQRWDRPNTFDITRRASGHLGFGTGIHGCVGQAVARMEAESLISALTARVKSLAPAGQPVRRLNNTLRGLSSLPVRVQPV
jgi:4-methoxybenzoate monooxygenase (O-demethylating)